MEHCQLSMQARKTGLRTPCVSSTTFRLTELPTRPKRSPFCSLHAVLQRFAGLAAYCPWSGWNPAEKNAKILNSKKGGIHTTTAGKHPGADGRPQLQEESRGSFTPTCYRCGDPHTAPKEHIYKSLRFVHSPMSPFIFKQVYKKFTMLVYLSSSTMNLQAKIGVYKAVNSCK